MCKILSKKKKRPQVIGTEKRLMVASGGMCKMGEGTQKVQTSNYKISHRDIIYSIGNIANNIIITVVTDGNQTYGGDHFAIYKSIKL